MKNPYIALSLYQQRNIHSNKIQWILGSINKKRMNCKTYIDTYEIFERVGMMKLTIWNLLPNGFSKYCTSRRHMHMEIGRSTTMLKVNAY